MEAEGYAMTRYADDMVILCRSAEEATQALETVKAWGLIPHSYPYRKMNCSGSRFRY